MSKSSGISTGFLLTLILLLFTSSLSSPKYLVIASHVPQPPGHHDHNYNRPDPLHHFKPYHGHYDVRNRHYWASLAFTGIHGYAMAGIWILGGLGLGIFVLIKNHCRSTSSSTITEHSDAYYIIPFLVVILFTILAIIGSSLVIVENQSSMWREKKLKQTLVGAGEETRKTIGTVTKAMNEIRLLLRPYDPSLYSRLNHTSRRLERESHLIGRFIFGNLRSLDLSIQTSYWTTTGIVLINLAVGVAALVMLLLHWRWSLIMIIFLCWILTSLCWVLTGVHFLMHTFVEDTCAAFEEFQQSPGNSSLSSILPCLDAVHADRIMIEIGYKIHNFISELNSNIQKLGQLLGLDEEESEVVFGKFRQVCDPFLGGPDYSYNPNRCPKDSTTIDEIPKELARFTCHGGGGGGGTCSSNRRGGGRKKILISEAALDMAWAYAHSIQRLMNVFPDLRDLMHCSLLKETFNDVLLHQCRPLRVSVKLLWASMMSLSVFMIVLVLAWVTKACQNRGRSFFRCSIVPRTS